MRSVAIAFLLAAILLIVSADTPNPSPPLASDDPVGVFSSLDGTWKGVFVGYDESGKELYRIRVRQIYRTVNETTQKVEIVDTMSDGTVIRGEGENVATRSEDGSLALRCVVRKSNGEEVVHDGRVTRGPDGTKELIWYSKKPDRVETFRELVRTEGGKTLYEIHGMGRYGKTLMLMAGRYYKE